MTDMITHQGGCHCGMVAFEVDAPAEVTVQDCNCSLCRMTSFLHLIVPASRFRLQRGQEALTSYTFNTGTARHLFCKYCGVKSFYVPRSNPDGFSVNMRCVDQAAFSSVTAEPFDGQNWEANGESLRHLSEG